MSVPPIMAAATLSSLAPTLVAPSPAAVARQVTLVLVALPALVRDSVFFSPFFFSCRVAHQLRLFFFAQTLMSALLTTVVASASHLAPTLLARALAAHGTVFWFFVWLCVCLLLPCLLVVAAAPSSLRYFLPFIQQPCWLH